jgi:hypothetical protein
VDPYLNAHAQLVGAFGRFALAAGREDPNKTLAIHGRHKGIVSDLPTSGERRSAVMALRQTWSHTSPEVSIRAK